MKYMKCLTHPLPFHANKINPYCAEGSQPIMIKCSRGIPVNDEILIKKIVSLLYNLYYNINLLAYPTHILVVLGRSNGMNIRFIFFWNRFIINRGVIITFNACEYSISCLYNIFIVMIKIKLIIIPLSFKIGYFDR